MLLPPSAGYAVGVLGDELVHEIVEGPVRCGSMGYPSVRTRATRRGFRLKSPGQSPKQPSETLEQAFAQSNPHSISACQASNARRYSEWIALSERPIR